MTENNFSSLWTSPSGDGITREARRINHKKERDGKCEALTTLAQQQLQLDRKREEKTKMEKWKYQGRSLKKKVKDLNAYQMRETREERMTRGNVACDKYFYVLFPLSSKSDSAQ